MLSCNIAVTGLNATDNPAPGIPVIRSLRSLWSGKIIGLAYDALDTGIYDNNLLDQVYLIPYPTDGEESLLQRIKEIIKKTPIDVIIPTLDSELLNFIHLQPEMEKLGIKMFLPTETLLALRSKIHLQEFCLKNSFNAPRTKIINDLGELKKSKLKIPLVIKGIFYEAYTVFSQEEAQVAFQKIKVKWGLPIIVQEYILGEEYDIVALGNNGECVGKVAMRKLALTEKGKAWAGITVKDQNLLELTEEVIKKLKWNGPMELEVMKDTVKKKYYILEINPRTPSWIYLATAAGQNLPLAIVKLALNEAFSPYNDYQSGLTFVRHAVDLVCPINYLENLTTQGELIFK